MGSVPFQYPYFVLSGPVYCDGKMYVNVIRLFLNKTEQMLFYEYRRLAEHHDLECDILSRVRHLGSYSARQLLVLNANALTRS